MAGKKFRILLVDDDEIIRIYFHDIFWIHGLESRCDLLFAADLDDAGKIVADPAKRPDIIFLDLTLPKKIEGRTIFDTENSFAFLRHIKQDPELKHIRVVIFSGHSEKAYQDEAARSGADDFVQKSESLPKDLIAVVEDMIKKVGERT